MRVTPTLVLSLGVALFAGCATSPTSEPSAPSAPAPSPQATIVSGQIYDLAKVPVKPRPIRQGPPRYPIALRKRGIQGFAVVDFIVGTDGSVQNAFSIKASNELFAGAAVAAVRGWRFSPGQVDGHPVNTHMQVPIQFTLQGD